MKTTKIRFTEVVRHQLELWANTDLDLSKRDMYDRFVKGGEQLVNIDDVNEILWWTDAQLNNSDSDFHFTRQELYSIREMNRRAIEALSRLQE